MESSGDEACALKVARALSYVNFSSLEKWLGHPGFIKIFQGLKGEGTDLGWAVMLGAIECAAAGDRHLPKQVMYRILRENRVTVQHLQELFGDSSPVSQGGGGLRVGEMDAVPGEAAPEMNAALHGFGQGRMGMQELGDELYRLHTGQMKDTLYYHALLTAKTVRHPISAHMLWKALSLLPAGSLRDEAVASAMVRLEELQGEHLMVAMRSSASIQAQSADSTRAVPGPLVARPVYDETMTQQPRDSRERAARLLKTWNLPAMSDRSSRIVALTGYDGPRIGALLEPFILRSFSDGDGSPAERGPVLAVGPPEVDKPAILQCLASALGQRFMLIPCSDIHSVWAGELESELLRIIDTAFHQAEGSHGRPVMLVISDGPPQEGHRSGIGKGAATPHEVADALACLLSGPRRREASPRPESAQVIPVVALMGPAGAPCRFGDCLSVVRLEPPGAVEIERLLILNLAGRFWQFDIDNISFPALAEQALGLTAGDIGRVAQRAKLRALGRKARQLGANLASAPARMRAEMIKHYMITQEDISSVIMAEKLARGGQRLARDGRPSAAAAPFLQADILRWEQGGTED